MWNLRRLQVFPVYSLPKCARHARTTPYINSISSEGKFSDPRKHSRVTNCLACLVTKRSESKRFCLLGDPKAGLSVGHRLDCDERFTTGVVSGGGTNDEILCSARISAPTCNIVPRSRDRKGHQSNRREFLRRWIFTFQARFWLAGYDWRQQPKPRI